MPNGRRFGPLPAIAELNHIPWANASGYPIAGDIWAVFSTTTFPFAATKNVGGSGLSRKPLCQYGMSDQSIFSSVTPAATTTAYMHPPHVVFYAYSKTVPQNAALLNQIRTDRM